MQNRYVGDVGDFGKYGLLRWLTGMTSGDDLVRLRLGVVWYLHPDEIERSPSRFDYLSNCAGNETFYECDVHLYENLQNLVVFNQNSIAEIQESNLLPDNTLYYGRRLFFERHEEVIPWEPRGQSWLDGAFNRVGKADVVFFDPDNGIASLGIERQNPHSPKHTFLCDIEQLANGGRRNLVILHSLHSTKSTDPGAATQEIYDRLQGAFPVALVWRLYYRPRNVVYFIVAPPGVHQDAIGIRRENFVEGANPWAQHFGQLP